MYIEASNRVFYTCQYQSETSSARVYTTHKRTHVMAWQSQLYRQACKNAAKRNIAFTLTRAQFDALLMRAEVVLMDAPDQRLRGQS